VVHEARRDNEAGEVADRLEFEKDLSNSSGARLPRWRGSCAILLTQMPNHTSWLGCGRGWVQERGGSENFEVCMWSVDQVRGKRVQVLRPTTPQNGSFLRLCQWATMLIDEGV
jgi:hypothetical protein